MECARVKDAIACQPLEVHIQMLSVCGLQQVRKQPSIQPTGVSNHPIMMIGLLVEPHLLFTQSYPSIISSTRALRRPIVKRSAVWQTLTSRGIANLPSDAVSPLKTGTNEIDFSR